MVLVCPHRRFLLVGRASLELIADANPLEHEDLVFDLDLALSVREQMSLVRLDPARLQRAA
jgi:hypothetical protein